MTAQFTPKQPYEAFAVCFDFAAVLGVETISGVIVYAVDMADMSDVSNTLLDIGRQVTTPTAVYPWVRDGLDGHTYLISCRVIGTSNSQYELDGMLPVVELPVSGPGTALLTNNNLSFKKMSGTSIELIGKQGTTWGPYVIGILVDALPIDLTGYVVRGQMRKDYTSAPVAGISFDMFRAAYGEVAISAEATATAAITCGTDVKADTNKYIFDVELYNAFTGVVLRYFGGVIWIDPEVTKI
jgi:hypothetical protein